eukprot:Gregarina_sp_Poly_1__3337@NODE_195_length_11596_cov_85_481395_g174_i0_p2_GENE_NODE_195_length_11596_cov_85_481395_g174_i0NODE_195_length_11596_cov_85_481395_g174_i0_p2_ORF_typecomplete_len563_score50_63_NODE_195_length_11596_cov_85_481395_g174_i081609848
MRFRFNTFLGTLHPYTYMFPPPRLQATNTVLFQFYKVSSWSKVGNILHQKRKLFPRNDWIKFQKESQEGATNMELSAVLPLAIRPKSRVPKLRNSFRNAGRVLVSCSQGSNQFSSLCRVRCQNCTESAQLLGEDLNLLITARRAHFHSYKNAIEKKGFNLGQLPCENGQYEIEIGFPPVYLKGRVLTLTAIFAGHKQTALSTATLFDTTALKEGKEALLSLEQPDSILTSPLICLFPPNERVNGWSPAKERYRNRLVAQSENNEVSVLYPVDTLVNSLGYFVLKPASKLVETSSINSWILRGKMCFPDYDRARPVQLEGPSGCIGGSFQAHVKPRSLLYPLPGRIYEVDLTDVEACPLGTLYRAVSLTSNSSRLPLDHTCVLSLLRTAHKLETSNERDQAAERLMTFIDTAVCSRASVLPPPEAARFSPAQITFIFCICATFVALAVFQCLPLERLEAYENEEPVKPSKPGDGKRLDLTTTAASISDSPVLGRPLMARFPRTKRDAGSRSPSLSFNTVPSSPLPLMRRVSHSRVLDIRRTSLPAENGHRRVSDSQLYEFQLA